MDTCLMKRTICTAVAFCAILLGVLSPLTAKDRLIAYPVPLNPALQTLQLKYQSSASVSNVDVDIFDINGDKVFSRHYAALSDFRWKGFSGSGRSVGAGLYIVKVKSEDSATGAVKTDTVRILVKR